MKIAVVCPTFPPDPCGVGDYNSKLCDALTSEGHQICVWTTQEKPQSTLASFVLRTIPRPWGWSSFRKTVHEIRQWEPDQIIIQFTPHLYSRSVGLSNFLLAPWILILKGVTRVPVTLVAHELHYPLEFSIPGITHGLPQFVNVFPLLLSANHVFFTYEKARSYALRYLPWKERDFHWLPVGANIEPIGPSDESKSVGQDIQGKVLLHFGTSHPGHLYGHVFAALRKCPPSTFLVLVGISPPVLETLLKKNRSMDLKDRILALGYLPAHGVSDWMKRADLVLAPLHDGVSTRRTSVMAALAHGKTVMTTKGHCTDPSIGWEKFCVLTSAPSKEDYAIAVARTLSSEEIAISLGLAGKTTWEENFSWPVIVRKLIHTIQGDSCDAKTILTGGSYAKKQLFSKSLLISWSHSGRFETGKRLLEPYAGSKLLDYGSGDGSFLILVHDLFPKATGADIDPKQIRECRQRIQESLGIEFYCTDELAAPAYEGSFEIVTCMEVLEHCIPEREREVLDQLARLTASDGKIIISVPIEIGPTLVIKEAARTIAGWRGIGDYRYKEKYRFSEFVRMSFAGKNTLIDRPVWQSDFTPERPNLYHGHKGFNWRNFHVRLAERFTIERVAFSPVSWLGPWLNSQAWFVCRNRKPRNRSGSSVPE